MASKHRATVLRASLVATALGVLASASWGLGRYPYSTELPDGIRNSVVRVTAPNARPGFITLGTGTVFDIHLDDPQNSQSGGWLCILTADHVVNLEGNYAIGFGDGGPAGPTDPQLNNLTAQKRIKIWGTEDEDGNLVFPDIAVLGARFDDASKLPEITLPRLPDIDVNVEEDLVQAGFGKIGLPFNNGNGYSYRASNTYGTYLAGQNTADNFDENFELRGGEKDYVFDAFQGDWDRFQYAPGLVGGESYIFSGDSGGPTFSDRDGYELVGVHSASQRRIDSETGIEIAVESSDLWTDVNVAEYKFEIERACEQIVPEPSSMIALAGGGLALLAKRRRRK